MNIVYQSLKAVLPEISSQLTNLHSGVNCHQNTSMDYLCSNFHQIKDNFITVKNYNYRTTTFSDTHFSSIAQGLKEIIIHLNH